MNPTEIYAQEAIYTTKRLEYLKGFYFDHIPEITTDAYLLSTKNTKITIKFYTYRVFSCGRRVWRMGAVFFNRDGLVTKPVMIIQNAGREGDDFSKRFITDLALYEEMIRYLYSLDAPQATGKDVFSLKDEVPDYFYGHNSQTILTATHPLDLSFLEKMDNIGTEEAHHS